jgi:hypothetical protein
MVVFEGIPSGDFKWIVPETEKRTIAASLVFKAALKLPAPSSSRLVTILTFPPLPPVAYFPKPSAPGNAIGLSSGADATGGSFCAQETAVMQNKMAEQKIFSFIILKRRLLF